MSTTIRFKGQNLSRTKVKNNILRMWNDTTEDERHDWYKEANLYAFNLAAMLLGGSFPDNHRKVCGIIAALSPVKTWEQNKKIARDLLETGECGHMKQFVHKAKKIISCDGSDESILSILNGRKISSFYLNIMYPASAEHVTIDRHALSICLGYWITEDDYRGMTANQYEFFVQCFVLAAVKVGVKPLLMQSATWVRWRKIKQDYKR